MPSNIETAEHHLNEIKHLHDNAGSIDQALFHRAEMDKCHRRSSRNHGNPGEQITILAKVEEADRLIEEMRKGD